MATIPQELVTGIPQFVLLLMLRALIRGGTICYFSVNIRDRFLGPMVLDAFCHNKIENNFENFEN